MGNGYNGLRANYPLPFGDLRYALSRYRHFGDLHLGLLF